MSRELKHVLLGSVLGLTLVSAMPQSVLAQANGIFAGKSISFIIGAGVGGGYDLWGRTISKHMGKYLPGNPIIVPQNMPAGGGIGAANHMASVAPKDGTTFGLTTRDTPMAPMMSNPAARFDPDKISWIGTPTTESNVCIARSSLGFQSYKDLKQKTLIVGDTGAGTGTHMYPLALNGLFDMKFKLITGFPSSADVFLAIERNEVDGICESIDSVHDKRPDWLPSGKMKILLQGGAEPNPNLKDIPFVMELASNERERLALRFLYAGQGIGRPMLAPPDLPPDRLKLLRDAFDSTMKDPDFIADTQKLHLRLEPVSGVKLAELIAELGKTPKDIRDQIGKFVN